METSISTQSLAPKRAKRLVRPARIVSFTIYNIYATPNPNPSPVKVEGRNVSTPDYAIFEIKMVISLPFPFTGEREWIGVAMFLIIPVKEIVVRIFLNVQFTYLFINSIPELVNIYFLLGRDEQTTEVVRIGVLVDLSHPCALEVFE